MLMKKKNLFILTFTLLISGTLFLIPTLFPSVLDKISEKISSKISEKVSSMKPAAVAQTASNPLNILLFGDWGRDGGYQQKPVANAMHNYITQNPTDFIVSTGDNFYEYGVLTILDTKFVTSYSSIYSSTVRNKDWYVSLGNHDYMLGTESMQILYGALLNPRWKMPSKYYTFTKGDVQFFVLDTTPYDPNFWNLFYLLIRPNTAAQTTWLQTQLAASTAKWKIVIGHHPMWASGENGVEDGPFMEENFLNMFEQYGVDAYVSGHDHHLEYLKKPNSTVHYFVTGAGSKIDPLVTTHPNQVWAQAVAGFLTLNFADNVMTAKFYDTSLNVLYSTQVVKP